MYCNRIFENKLLRIILSILFAVIFVIVPIENRMITAQAAVQAAILIPVICAVLVAMGITFGGTYLNNTELQNANLNWRDNISQSLLDLAQDIYDNCPGIIEVLASSFPGGLTVIEGVKRIVQIDPRVYQLIKKYFIQNYGESAQLEDAINGGTYFHSGVIKCGSEFLTPNSAYDKDNISNYIGTSDFSFTLVNNSSYVTTYGAPCTVSGYFNFVSVSSKGVYTYNNAIKYSGSEKSAVKYPANSYTYDPGSCAFVLTYGNINAPDDYAPYGSVDLYVRSRYTSTDDTVKSYSSYIVSSGNVGTVQFGSEEEYKAAVGETDVAAFDIVDVDSNVYDMATANYPKYVYVYENAADYVGQTSTDVAAPAYSDVYDSNVVDTATRTVMWQGDRTLCPIDELQGSIPADVIGTWNATWDATSTLCDITCYAEDGTVLWTGSIATTLTWAEVLEMLGDITITGPIGSAAITGSLALPDVALNFDPLKIAGDTFSKKFPFCLPFDLYRAFLQFNTEEAAEAPVYKLPLNFGEHFGTHYIVIDMNEWSSVAAIVKWCTYISFMVSLIVVTKKIMGGS